MLKSLKQYFSQNTMTYIIIGSIISLNVLYTIINYFFSIDFINQNSDMQSGLLIQLIIILLALVLASTINLLGFSFKFNKLFGKPVKNTFKELLVYMLLQSFLISLVFNIVILLALNTESFREIPLIIYGLKMHLIDGILLKLVLTTIVFFFIHILFSWCIIAFMRYGKTITSSRIVICIAIMIFTVKRSAFFYNFGRESHLSIAMLLIITSLLTAHTYIDMSKLQLKN